jgi:hypothetical protein
VPGPFNLNWRSKRSSQDIIIPESSQIDIESIISNIGADTFRHNISFVNNYFHPVYLLTRCERIANAGDVTYDSGLCLDGTVVPGGRAWKTLISLGEVSSPTCRKEARGTFRLSNSTTNRKIKITVIRTDRTHQKRGARVSKEHIV